MTRNERRKKEITKERQEKYWVAAEREVKMSAEGRNGRCENKERLLSVVLLIGKTPQAPSVERCYTYSCYTLTATQIQAHKHIKGWDEAQTHRRS